MKNFSLFGVLIHQFNLGIGILFRFPSVDFNSLVTSHALMNIKKRNALILKSESSCETRKIRASVKYPKKERMAKNLNSACSQSFCQRFEFFFLCFFKKFEIFWEQFVNIRTPFKMGTSLIVLFLSVLSIENSDATVRVRRVPVKNDQIVSVRTSIGIATIIQVPDRPNSVVCGDTDAFKVEYLDQAITIKPLAIGAKSNLYIYTDWKRFNVELVSGSETVADYVVYLDNPKTAPKPSETVKKDSGIIWTNFRNLLRNDSLELKVKKLGRTKNGILLVEFDISSKKKEHFKPEWLWLSQNNVTKPIHNLFLSALEVSPQRSLSGVMQLKENDVESTEPMRLELRRNKLSYLTIMKASSWKR